LILLCESLTSLESTYLRGWSGLAKMKSAFPFKAEKQVQKDHERSFGLKEILYSLIAIYDQNGIIRGRVLTV